MIGADGQQYGPITLEQVRAWIREQRITANTQIRRSDGNAWLPANQYVELGLGQAGVAPGAPMPMPAINNSTGNLLLMAQARSAARWFYWIAGLSLVNTIMAMSSAGFVFLFGLGVTQLIDGAVGQMESTGKMVGLVLNLVVVGIFAMFGFFASKQQSWSYIAGMVLYFLDAALILGASMMASVPVPWISVAFHAYVLFRLFTGLQANLKLKSMARGVTA